MTQGPVAKLGQRSFDVVGDRQRFVGSQDPVDLLGEELGAATLTLQRLSGPAVISGLDAGDVESGPGGALTRAARPGPSLAPPESGIGRSIARARPQVQSVMLSIPPAILPYSSTALPLPRRERKTITTITRRAATTPMMIQVVVLVPPDWLSTAAAGLSFR